MDKYKLHKGWRLFLENSQLGLDPVQGARIQNRPSMRVDPEDPDPDSERDLDADELAMLLQKANSENPATGMRQVDSDFKHPNQDIINMKFTKMTDFEAADTWDIKDDERINKAIADFNKVKGNLPTLDLKQLQELIVKEVRNILNERKKTNLHRE